MGFYDFKLRQLNGQEKSLEVYITKLLQLLENEEL